MSHAVSALAILLVAIGFAFRRRRTVHVPAMSAAFIVDISLLVYVEVTRHAVEKALLFPRWLVGVHVAVSVGVLACYLVMILLGRRILGGTVASRTAHRRVGITFVVLRGLNYVTALMI
jgi:hypothetical protein